MSGLLLDLPEVVRKIGIEVIGEVPGRNVQHRGQSQ